jgi:hypothetical protein
VIAGIKVIRLFELLLVGKALSLRVRAVVGKTITELISLAFTFAFAQTSVEFALGLACITHIFRSIPGSGIVGVLVSFVIATPVPDSHADPAADSHADQAELVLALLARRVEACLVLFNATKALGAGLGVGHDPIAVVYVPLGQTRATGR